MDGAVPPLSRKQAAKDAGLSELQQKKPAAWEEYQAAGSGLAAMEESYQSGRASGPDMLVL